MRTGCVLFSSCLLLIACTLLTGCAANRAYHHGVRAEQVELYAEAIRYYTEAAGHDPYNPKYRVALSSALVKSGEAHIARGEAFERAGEIELAYREYDQACQENPFSDRAQLKRDVMRKRLLAAALPEPARKEPPIQSPLVPLSGDLVNLKMTDADVQEVLTSIERLTGVMFVYDPDFKSRKVTVDFRSVSFKDVLDRVTLLAHLFYRPIDSHTLLIANDTDAKRMELEEQVLKTFYLQNADPAAVANNLKSMVDLKRVTVEPNLRTITIKDSPAKVELARRLIERDDMRRAEVVVDMEILEYNRNRLRQYGMDLGSYSAGAAVSLSPGTTFPASTLVRGHMLGSIQASDLLFSIPSVVYRLLRTDTHTRLVAKPQMRTLAGETVNVKIGERIPIPVTTYVPISGGGVNNQPVTSFQMEPIGLDIELTPTVYLDGEVSLKLKFNVSSVVREGTTFQPPTLGTRSITSTIRLKDGETTLIAGLIRDEERQSRTGLPGLSSLPVLGRFFSSNQDSGEKTDIALTLTPHIVRMAEVTDEDRKVVWVGTEHDLRVSDEPPPFTGPREGEAPAEPAVAPESKSIQSPAPGEATLAIDPSVTRVPPNSPFSLQLSLRIAETPIACEIVIAYDAQTLQFVSADPAAAIGPYALDANVPGQIVFRISPAGPFDGPVLRLIFTGKLPGTTQLTASATTVQSPAGQAHESAVCRTEIEITVPAKPRSDPSHDSVQ